jgi:hypothetical protein
MVGGDDKPLMNNISLNEFLAKIKKVEKGEKLDLSSGEDLSIGIMNLIAIEEHMFFTASKMNDSKYYDILNEVREMRKKLMKELVKENEGELWCTSKHLLAASMRLQEVGTKMLGKGDKKKAEDLFKKAYHLYSLFWVINLNESQSSNLKSQNDSIRNNPLEIRGNPNDNKQTEDKITLIDDKGERRESMSIFERAGDLVKKILDCCKE